MQQDYKIFWIFAYASIFSALIPLTVGLIRFKDRAFELKLLCILSLLGFCLDLIPIPKPIFSNEAANTFLIMEFCTLLLIYARLLNLQSRIWLILATIIYFTIFIAELYFSSKTEINSYSLTYTSLLFLFFSVRYFYFLLRDLPTDKIQRLPMFWINTGVLIYFAGGLFLFAMRNYLIEAFHDNQTMYWSFHNFLNIVKNLLFAVALWQDLRKPKPI